MENKKAKPYPPSADAASIQRLKPLAFQSHVVMDFERADKLRDRLRTLRPLNETELKRLREEFMIENTYNSNAIEGNTLTLKETALILQQGVTINGKHIRDHLEAIGHKDAFYYMIELADVGTTLTERIIKELHSLVLIHDAKNKGTYRTLEVAILGASHSPSPHYLIRERMEDLLRDYEKMKQNMHITKAAAEFHLRFEGIHPFIDGNGRTGRLILNLELIKAGFLPINIKFTDREKYYDCFDSCYAIGETSDALTQLILTYEEEEILKYIARLGEGADLP
ncbi:MAG: Fic family protein [Synergistaceae bacterium]|jgi:Fic family protein|nr:Fic family protein [Synergistaceae bacterium]